MIRREREVSVGTVVMLFAIIVAFVGFIKVSGGLNIEYSEGSRSGSVQKLSKKGLFYKTWEGELNLGYMEKDSDSGLRPAIFAFSVTKPEVVEELKQAELHGKRVTLEYKQYWLRGYDKGQTGYDIVKVETSQ